MKEHPTLKGYYVTEDGEVWSQRKYKSPHKLRSHLSSHGRVYVNVMDKNRVVHRLVAETFIPNPNNLPEVNHIDENPTNNHVSNLEWCDRQYNAEYSLAKTHKVLNVKTNEVMTIHNLRKWCKDHELDHATLWKTSSPKYRDKTHKGYKLLTS